MRIILRILRTEEASDATAGRSSAFFQEFAVEVDPSARVLDALLEVQADQDATLAFRRRCGHGVCGSDAMTMNGQSGLACKTLIREVAAADGAVVTIEPLRHLPALRDLIVDQETFFHRYRVVKPYLIAAGPGPERERPQTEEERARISDATNCILCGACLSACPVLDENRAFLGSAAIVQAWRFDADSRDAGFVGRLDALDAPDAVWACANHYECTRACPRGIKITRLINATKRQIRAHRSAQAE